MSLTWRSLTGLTQRSVQGRCLADETRFKAYNRMITLRVHVPIELVLYTLLLKCLYGHDMGRL